MLKKIIPSIVFPLLIALSLIPSGGLAQKPSPVRVGDPFPPFSLKNNLSQEELKALRLPPKESITLNDFTSEIILVEMLNVHCHTCKEQVPVFNQLWDSLKSNQILKNKVDLIGITVGNNPKEISAFQKGFTPRYPIFADPSKRVFDSLGNMKEGTPQTYLLRKAPSGAWFVLYHHPGSVGSHEVYLRKIEALYKADLEGLEPGYKVPQLLLTTLKIKYPSEPFKNKRLLLYFPPLEAFPLDDDIRNAGNQLKVVLSFVNEENLVIVIIGALNRIFSPQELEKLQKIPTTLLLQDDTGTLQRRFEVGENPLLCLVNDSERIVYRSHSLTHARAEEILQGKVTPLTPNLTKKELLKLMQNSMKVVEEGIETIEKKELENSETIYLGFTGEEKQNASLFGRVVSKYSICDICHNVHFFYILDHNGHIVYLSPIGLTKFGNVTWDQQDIAKLKSRVVGKDPFKPLLFDPYVDAVSQATMTSYLIFEGLNETKTILQNFSDNGFRSEHWKALCLHNLCQIKKTISLEEKALPGSFTLEDHTTLDMEKLQKYFPSKTVSKCPTGGNYLLIGENLLCSIHGMNLEPCPK